MTTFAGYTDHSFKEYDYLLCEKSLSAGALAYRRYSRDTHNLANRQIGIVSPHDSNGAKSCNAFPVLFFEFASVFVEMNSFQHRCLIVISFTILISGSVALPISSMLEKVKKDMKNVEVRQEATEAPTTTAASSPTNPVEVEPDLPSSPYTNNATTEPYPTSQPAQTRQQVVSILIQSNSFNDEIALATKECLGVGTGTIVEQWGLWSAVQFASNMIQAEFFCNVPERIAGTQFRSSILEYVTDQGGLGLTNCLQRNGIGFTGNALLGREPEDRDDLVYSSVADGSGIPAFIPGILIGVLGLICLTAILITVKAASRKTYDPSDYLEPTQPEAEARKELTEEEELAMLAQ